MAAFEQQAANAVRIGRIRQLERLTLFVLPCDPDHIEGAPSTATDLGNCATYGTAIRDARPPAVDEQGLPDLYIVSDVNLERGAQTRTVAANQRDSADAVAGRGFSDDPGRWSDIEPPHYFDVPRNLDHLQLNAFE